MRSDPLTGAPDGAVPVETCACGHDIRYHGRRGYGACWRGGSGFLAYAVAAVRQGVATGASQDEIRDGIEHASAITPCQCKRFHKRSA